MKKIEEIVNLIHRQENVDRDLSAELVDFQTNYEEVVHEMKQREIPLAFYPFILKKAMGDPIAWAVVEQLLGEKLTCHQSIT